MLLVYIDESYRNVNDKFCIAAVMCTPEGVSALAAELDAIVAAAKP